MYLKKIKYITSPEKTVISHTWLVCQYELMVAFHSQIILFEKLIFDDHSISHKLQQFSLVHMPVAIEGNEVYNWERTGHCPCTCACI